MQINSQHNLTVKLGSSICTFYKHAYAKLDPPDICLLISLPFQTMPASLPNNANHHSTQTAKIIHDTFRRGTTSSLACCTCCFPEFPIIGIIYTAPSACLSMIGAAGGVVIAIFASTLVSGLIASVLGTCLDKSRSMLRAFCRKYITQATVSRQQHASDAEA